MNSLRCNPEGYPHVDIIIVNYNGMDYLPVCLESLFETDYPSFRVIMVDNCSQDASVPWLKENYPKVLLVENPSNEGFGAANLKGVSLSGSKYFAFLNNDTRVDKNWLLKLVDVMEKNPSSAASCSKLLFMKNPEIVNAQGGGMNCLGYGYDRGIFTMDREASDEVEDVFFPTAAACLVRRAAFEDIGGFDRSFFMYHEDVDLGWRFNIRGYDVKYVPDSVVYHAFGGTSMKTGSMHFRNSLGLRHALRSLLKNYQVSTLRRILPLFFRINFNNFRAGVSTGFFKAILWNLLRLPGTLVHRLSIQRKRRRDDGQISSLIWQDIHMPVHFPDYEAKGIKSFDGAGDRIDIVDNSLSNLGYGWYPCESFFDDSSIIYRWTRKEAVFFFSHTGEGGWLQMKILGLSGLVGEERRWAVELRERSCYEASSRHEFTVSSDGWESFNIPLPERTGVVEVKILVENTWSPHDKFENSDYRDLGIGVSEAAVVYNETA